MSSDETNWPPSDGLCTPTVARGAAILTTSSSATVHAPASLVFDIVRDTSRYGEWNTWVPRVTIHSQPDGVPADSKMLEVGTSFTYHVVMDTKKPDKETLTQLRVSDTSTPEKQSKYLVDAGIQDDASFHSDLGSVYRISWKTEGGFVARGLRSERFHEIIVRGEEECEVRTWEIMGGFLAHTVNWMFKASLKKWFGIWCEELKKEGERQWAEQKEKEMKEDESNGVAK